MRQAMRWLVCLCLLAGTRLGAMAVGPAASVPPVHLAVSVAHVVDAPPPPAPPPPAAHAITCGDPKTIGTPVATLETELQPGHLHWQLAASRHACVIAAWTADELVVSWDDGATFAPLLGAPIVGSRIQSVAVGDTGAIFVLRKDFALEVHHPDGTTVIRHLTFGAEGQLNVRGRWLWLSRRVMEDSPAITSDDGATWLQLDWTTGVLADLQILADGSVLGLADYHTSNCDHFGCGEPLTETFESNLDGRPWKRARRELPQVDYRVLDRHGLEITRDNDSRGIVRQVGRTYRRLYVTRPS